MPEHTDTPAARPARHPGSVPRSQPARIAVVGCGGAGKSTLAGQLGRRLALPVVHLDELYWQPGWVEPDPAAFRSRQEELAARPAWVIDGNYSATLDVRVAYADWIIVLDLPRRRCLVRVVRRWARFRGTSRPTMASACPERLRLEFLRYVWRYRSVSLPKVHRKLAANPTARVITLRSPAEVATFLDGLPAATAAA